MPRQPRTMTGSEAGFTLTELLIVCALIGFIMSGLYALLASGQQTYLTGTNQMDAQQALRLAVQRMTSEIRDAGYCPTCGTGSPGITPFSAITSANATGFTLQNDWDASWSGTAGINTTSSVNYAVVNNDGTTTTTQRGEQIIYAFSAGTLTRQEIGIDAAPVALAGNLAALTFTFLDRNGTVLTTPVPAAQEANIRTIVINAVGQPQVQPSTFQAGRVQVAMTDAVRLRNRAP
jgi:prepilin-type N-terminal cleavage/methylation domain-containing protein